MNLITATQNLWAGGKISYSKEIISMINETENANTIARTVFDKMKTVNISDKGFQKIYHAAVQKSAPEERPELLEYIVHCYAKKIKQIKFGTTFFLNKNSLTTFVNDNDDISSISAYHDKQLAILSGKSVGMVRKDQYQVPRYGNQGAFSYGVAAKKTSDPD